MIYCWGRNDEGQLGLGDTYGDYRKKKAAEELAKAEQAAKEEEEEKKKQEEQAKNKAAEIEAKPAESVPMSDIPKPEGEDAQVGQPPSDVPMTGDD